MGGGRGLGGPWIRHWHSSGQAVGVDSFLILKENHITNRVVMVAILQNNEITVWPSTFLDRLASTSADTIDG
jgi:hypothetical protein